ncbi:MAG: 2-amino-3,7-dideoxy-D-threo-hept-6-ulosonate synthase [Candidatus Bathyarchaeia archaeon]|nr:2-amino-3,7-dideoxy-D-threo-hept-6-ulosonate synthase [Candidatus Bathyarchaeia archaeon]
MEQGKKRRMKRILQKDNRTVIVPMDHGVSMGPIKGITNMQNIINQLLKGGVDAVVLNKGIAKRVELDNAGLIVHLSAISSLTPNANNKVQVCTVQEAIRIGADAVSVHINAGAPEEDKMLEKLGKVADKCDIHGIPLLAMMYPRGPKIKSEHDVEVVAHAARLGAELGADIIKTNYTGNTETFKTVVEGCPVPVIIAGGPKCKTEHEILQTAYESIQSGGSGLSIGRNVFQYKFPSLMVKALSVIVHRGASVEQALKILGESP